MRECRICKYCKRDESETSFYADTVNYKDRCRDCHRAIVKKYTSNNREKINEYYRNRRKEKRMKENSFVRQNRLGMIAENQVIDLYRDDYTVIRNTCNTDDFKEKQTQLQKWDLKLVEIDKTIEVKYDAKAYTTQNYFLEFGSDGEPSGISVSEADTYFIIIPTEIMSIRETHCYKLQELKELVKEYPLREIAIYDDNVKKVKQARLVPIEALKSIRYDFNTIFSN